MMIYLPPPPPVAVVAQASTASADIRPEDWIENAVVDRTVSRPVGVATLMPDDERAAPAPVDRQPGARWTPDAETMGSDVYVAVVITRRPAHERWRDRAEPNRTPGSLKQLTPTSRSPSRASDGLAHASVWQGRDISSRRRPSGTAGPTVKRRSELAPCRQAIDEGGRRTVPSLIGPEAVG